jgi:hypothetical protein
MYSLAEAILQEDTNAVRQLLRYGADANQIDEFGYTPLVEAAIVENRDITNLLLQHHANPNQQDVTGGTALHWAVENNNHALVEQLLAHGADPNAYNLAGQSVLVMPTLRRQTAMRQRLVQAGADEIFAQDYINTKLLGHMFELVGIVNIIDPKQHFVEVDFEGFFLEVTIGLISHSLAQFQNHFAARDLRRYAGLSQYIVQVMERASQLIKYQQYRVDIKKYADKINALIDTDPLIIPVGYEGHAITFIKHADWWVKCDRREDSRLYDNVMVYRITNKQNFNTDFVKNLIYVKQDSDYVNRDIDRILGLQPITEVKVDAQISGNCSWANVEATIPALFFLVLMQLNPDKSTHAYYKTLATNYFQRWREWNQDRALSYCVQSFEQGDTIRKACKAEILAAILFQRCDPTDLKDRGRIESILGLLLNSPYEYLLRNYVRVYYYESNTDEGKRFYHLLKEFGMQF